MGDGALGSDHINYLILRYLQEAGHENAAKALHQDWHRPVEYNDPEKLPFAQQVKQFELVNIIQDGLFHDQLQAQVTKQTPRFSLIQAARLPQSQSTTRTSTAETRQKQSQRRRSSQNDHADQDDFPIPAPKRVRKTNGDDVAAAGAGAAPHVNGDGLEVDSKTPVTTAEDGDGRSDEGVPTDTDRAMSEAVDRGHDLSSPPLRPVETASEGTQTDKKLKARKSETVYWSVEKEDASILHAIWNPIPEMATRLLAVGDSLCRFYTLPEPTHDGSTDGHVAHVNEKHHFDVEDMPRGSLATAACWHPSGRYATCSIELPRQINGTQESFRCLFDTEGHRAYGGKRLYSDHAYINYLQGQGQTLTTALRYNKTGTHLLSISMSMKRGLIEIWQTPSEEPIAVKIFGKPILDAVWSAEDQIIVSGEDCLECYRINILDVADSVMTNGDSFASTGARNLTLLYSYQTDKTWDKVRYDPQNRVVAAISTVNDAIILLGQSPDNDAWVPLDGFPGADESSVKQVSAVAFEHSSLEQNGDGDTSSPRRIATTHHTGAVNIYAITRDSCTPVHTLHLGQPHTHEAALALSWSPNGNYLAAAGEESIKVWNPAAPHFPVLTWRASPEHWSQQGSGHIEDVIMDGEDVQTVNEPSLAWDAEGKSLLFAVGRRMAVIRLLA